MRTTRNQHPKKKPFQAKAWNGFFDVLQYR